MLSVHGIAMNGGLLHAIEFHDRQELDAGCAGLRYFGLDAAAEAIEQLADQAARLGPDPSPDRLEDLEQRAEQRYDALIPTDAALFDRFAATFEAHSEQFAPTP